MLVLLTTLIVAAGPAPVPFKAASVGVSVTGLPVERTEFYSEFVAQQMSAAGVNVVTPKQIAAILGIERQKQLLGCSESATNCTAEIASALGVDGIVQGEAAKLESGGFQVSLKVLWSRDGRPLTVFSGRGADEGSLLDVMGKGALLMSKDLTDGDWVRLTTSPASHTLTPSSPLKLVGLSLLGVGAVGAVTGIIGFVRSSAVATNLSMGTFVSQGEARAVAAEGASMQTLGAISFGVAGTALAVGAVMTILGFGSELRVGAWMSPGSSGLAFAGEWP